MIRIPAHLATLTPVTVTCSVRGYIMFNDGSTKVSTITISTATNLGAALVAAASITEAEIEKVLYFYITSVTGGDFYAGSSGISDIYSENAGLGNLRILAGNYEADPYRLGAII